ncbi:hypothetical protein Esti_002391 [Eimeria stiedai]
MQKQPRHKRWSCRSRLLPLLAVLAGVCSFYGELRLFAAAAEAPSSEPPVAREAAQSVSPASNTAADVVADLKSNEQKEREAGAAAPAKKKPQLRQPGPSQQRGKINSSSESETQQLSQGAHVPSPQRPEKQGEASLEGSFPPVELPSAPQDVPAPTMQEASAAAPQSSEVFPSQPQPSPSTRAGDNLLEEFLTRGGPSETDTQFSLRQPASLDAWAIGRAAAAAAAAGIPHLLIGVVLADGSVWGVDDLRGGIESALRSSSMLQQSLAMTDLQQQLMLLNQQQMLLDPYQTQLQQPYYYGSPQREYTDPYWNQWPTYPYRRRLQTTEGGRYGLQALSPAASAAASGRLLSLMQQRRLQEQLLQQQLLQQHCVATAGPAGAASCVAARGNRASAAASLVLPVVGWQPFRRPGSYQVHVRALDGGFEAVEVSAEELSRLLQGAQLPLQLDPSSEQRKPPQFGSSNVNPRQGKEVALPSLTSSGDANQKPNGDRTDASSPSQRRQPPLAMAIPLSDQRIATHLATCVMPACETYPPPPVLQTPSLGGSRQASPAGMGLPLEASPNNDNPRGRGEPL